MADTKKIAQLWLEKKADRDHVVWLNAFTSKIPGLTWKTERGGKVAHMLYRGKEFATLKPKGSFWEIYFQREDREIVFTRKPPVEYWFKQTVKSL